MSDLELIPFVLTPEVLTPIEVLCPGSQRYVYKCTCGFNTEKHSEHRGDPDWLDRVIDLKEHIISAHGEETWSALLKRVEDPLRATFERLKKMLENIEISDRWKKYIANVDKGGGVFSEETILLRLKVYRIDDYFACLNQRSNEVSAPCNATNLYVRLVKYTPEKLEKFMEKFRDLSEIMEASEALKELFKPVWRLKKAESDLYKTLYDLYICY